MITIKINGEDRQFPADITLSQVVEAWQRETAQALDPSVVATAVNEVFVPRQQRADYILKAHDEVFTFSPITGG